MGSLCFFVEYITANIYKVFKFCSRGLVVRVVDLRPRGRGFQAC